MTPGERTHEPRAKRLWKHGTVPFIGLTGGVAGGKSSVANLLTERGFTVIDADSVGHDVLNLPAVQSQLVDQFGPCVVSSREPSSEAGALVDRKALAAMVFADPKARHALEAIVHPLMRARFIEACESRLDSREFYVRPLVLDAAILIEAGWDDLCDLIVFVDAPRAQRLRRAVESRGWKEDDFAARERAQWPCERKRLRADFVFQNNGTLEALHPQMEAFLEMLEEHALSESAARSPVRSLAEARSSGRPGTDGSGSGAWQNPCPVS